MKKGDKKTYRPLGSNDEIELGFPWIPVLLMAAIFILGALMEAKNWSPFW